MFYMHFPSWLKPEIIKGLPVRWYGLMYLVAFAISYYLVRKLIREHKEIKASDEDVSNYFFWGIVGLMLGARLFSVFIYSDDRLYYLTHPHRIFWPFQNGQFIGLQGMSYHGGLVGAAAGFILYCRKHKRLVWQWGDMVAMAAPLGYTFGRLANFINGELFGRVTTRPWGMIFPSAEHFDTSLPWVQRVAEEISMPLNSAMVNLPRHPSQIYEALFEGVILWAMLWFVLRRKKWHHGAMVSFYLIGYGLSRFIIEYFREPDANLGHVISWGKGSEEIHLFHSFLNFSTGQILCFLMILGGIGLFFILKRLPQEQPEAPKVEKKDSPNMRKLRKKIK